MELNWLSRSEIYDLFNDPRLREEYQKKYFKYLELSYLDQDLVLCAFIDQKLVGCLQLGKSPYDQHLYWMKFVTVHPDFRRQNIARNLITEMCQYVSKIPDARIELSSYEKEGEVMIPMVQEIAANFPELSLKHRTFGSPYQDAKLDFLKPGDSVIVSDPHQNYYGEGIVLFFDESAHPLTLTIKTPQNQVWRVVHQFIKKNK